MLGDTMLFTLVLQSSATLMAWNRGANVINKAQHSITMLFWNKGTLIGRLCQLIVLNNQSVLFPNVLCWTLFIASASNSKFYAAVIFNKKSFAILVPGSFRQYWFRMLRSSRSRMTVCWLWPTSSRRVDPIVHLRSRTWPKTDCDRVTIKFG